MCQIDWLLYFNTFSLTELTDDEEVISMATTYVRGMAKLVRRTDRRYSGSFVDFGLAKYCYSCKHNLQSARIGLT